MHMALALLLVALALALALGKMLLFSRLSGIPSVISTRYASFVSNGLDILRKGLTS